MLALLGALPLIGNIVTALTTAFFNAKVSLVQARIGGDRDVAVKIVQSAVQQEHENSVKLGIFASNKLLTILLIAFAIPLVWYEWQGIVWDKLLCPHFPGHDFVCQTDPIKGQLADWGNTIIYFLFGAPTAMAIGKMWFGRDKTGE